MRTFFWLTILAVAVILWVRKTTKTTTTTTTTTTECPRVIRPPHEPSAFAKVRKEVADELMSYMGTEVDACEDFFKYSCGNWRKTHKVSVDNLDTTTVEEMDKVTTTIIRDLLVSLPESSSGLDKMMRDFYTSCITKEDRGKYPGPLAPSSDSVEDLNQDDNIDIDDGWGSLSPTLRKSIQPYLQSLDGDDQKTTTALSCATLTKKYFFYPVARLFVQHTYLDKCKAVTDLVEELRSTYKLMISKISWLSEGARDQIQNRFDTLALVLGYTERIMDKKQDILTYSFLKIRNDSYYSNVRELGSKYRSSLFPTRDDFTLMANAMYTGATGDNVLIPAGLTQKPFYDPDYPDIINYAKLAVAVGHELSHAFDNYLSNVDDYFSRKPWYMLSTDFDTFSSKKECIQEQYSHFDVGYEPYLSNVNGDKTFHENFADIAGLQLAFEAYMQNHKGSYQPLPGLEGVTQEQLFFVAAAQTQCRTFASEEARRNVLLDEIQMGTHSPNSIRVLGEMVNFPEFSKAFRCPKGSTYNPKKQCHIFD